MPEYEFDNDAIDHPLDQERLIASLDLRDLTELQDMFSEPDSSPWLAVVRRERISRERALEEARVYRPDLPESPAYQGGTEKYMSSIRRINLGGRLIGPDYQKLKYEKVLVDDMARDYLAQNRLRMERLDPAIGFENLIAFFASNLKYVVGAPRALAMREYDVARNAILRTHLLGLVVLNKDLLHTTARQIEGVTAERLQAAQTEIEGLPYKSPLSDFFQMDQSAQRSILQAFGEEWVELCTIMHTADPQLLHILKNRTNALAFRPVQELRQAIALNPLVSPADICKAFLRAPRTFVPCLAQLRSRAESAQRLEAFRRTETGPRLSENELKIRELLNDPRIHPEVLNLLPGDTAHITPKDTPIPGREFEKIVDAHLELLGRALAQAGPIHNPRGVALERWHKLNVGELLRGKFNGNLRNLSITRLRVTEEDLAQHLGSSYDHDIIQPEAVAKLVVQVEQKSTGRQSSPVFATLLLVVRKSETKKDAVYKSAHKVVSTGAAAAESLRREAVASARVIEGYKLESTINFGLRNIRRRE
jgi:hypothetical protein